MKDILALNLGEGDEVATFDLMGETIRLRRAGCRGDLEQARALIASCDGQVDAIALEGMPAELNLGSAHRSHPGGQELRGAATQTPVVDGSGVRPALERWGITLADRARDGIFSHKNILLVPGLNHEGLAQALRKYSKNIRYADPVVYFALPDFPGVGSRRTLDQVSGPTLDQLKNAPFRRLIPQPGTPGTARSSKPFEWAEVLAGDIGAIRRYAPRDLSHKIVVVLSADEQDLEDLRQRGVEVAIALIPESLGVPQRLGSGDATVEAILAALRPSPDAPLTEDTYLDLIANLDWMPDIRDLQGNGPGPNKFAFVIHPLNSSTIVNDPHFRWTRIFPESWVEAAAAYMPPMYLSRITGGKSPETGQEIEGYLITLGATPRQMMRKGARFTYERLNAAARIAERKGARIMGLGAFTSVVGDAGITVAHEAEIAITSGNSLTVAATLEAAKQAVIKMGVTDLTQGRAMVIGATGSIGSVCARLLAQAIYDVVLVSIEPEKLIDLKRRILEETPGSRVTIATRSEELVGSCDLVVTATSAFGQRVVDITLCKPGAVICDVARPPDINVEEAALRPDVLVIESGEVLIPGDIDFGYNIGLPPKTAYACLAETALLAMEGRFEDYTLGRNISMERVKEIYRLFKKHGFQLAGLRSFGKLITEGEFAQKRALAEQLRRNPALYEGQKAENAARLAAIPRMSKGVSSESSSRAGILWGMAGLSLLVLIVFKRLRNQKPRSCA